MTFGTSHSKDEAANTTTALVSYRKQTGTTPRASMTLEDAVRGFLIVISGFSKHSKLAFDLRAYINIQVLLRINTEQGL